MNRRLFACAVIVLLIASGVMGQRALDRNPQAGSGGINPHSRGVAVARPVYTVHRGTGEMAYNRANAFNDPVYNIHQRYSLSRFDYFDPTTTRATGAWTPNRPMRARPMGASSLSSPKYPVTPTIGRQTVRTPTYRAPSRAPTASMSRSSGPLTAPLYSPKPLSNRAR